MADDFNSDGGNGGWLQQLKESPRTVSALIIILIVAAAIYAFSGPENDSRDIDDHDDGMVASEDDPGQTAGTISTPEDIAAEESTLPAATRSEEGFTETANAGDGITHLARRATTRWLSENQPGYTITKEHRIYIEDYIQNRIGSEGLALGESRTISYDLITEAVSSAGQLNENNLNNLSQYAYVL